MSGVVGIGIDFGTSHTVAVVRRGDGRVEPLLFDGSPLLPSAVFVDDDGAVVVGRDAVYSARVAPTRFEPNPKRRIDDGTVLLGTQELSVVELFAAVLRRVRRECVAVLGSVPPAVVTHPAVWGPTRRTVLREAAASAGFAPVRLVAEPVAAAVYFVDQLGHDVAVGDALAVHDLGAGTFDAGVVGRTADGFEPLSVDGLDQLGGVDIDDALVTRLRGQVGDPDAWRRLLSPRTAAERRGWRTFVEDVRLAKERLSRRSSTELYVPIVDLDVHVTRPELEELARPLLSRAVSVVKAVIAEAAVPPSSLKGVFLVGGASRMPLVVTMLHQGLGMAPIVTDQLEHIVAHGALMTIRSEDGTDVAPVTDHVPRSSAVPVDSSTSDRPAESNPRAADGSAAPPVRSAVEPNVDPAPVTGADPDGGVREQGALEAEPGPASGRPESVTFTCHEAGPVARAAVWGVSLLFVTGGVYLFADGVTDFWGFVAAAAGVTVPGYFVYRFHRTPVTISAAGVKHRTEGAPVTLRWSEIADVTISPGTSQSRSRANIRKSPRGSYVLHAVRASPRELGAAVREHAPAAVQVRYEQSRPGRDVLPGID